MLVTQEAVFQRFWYPVIPKSHLLEQPFTCKLRINYPNGLVHIVVNTATPINDWSSQIVQFCLRNDTKADTTTADVVAFDRAVTLEDKAILETTDYNVPLDLKLEQHMMTDQPGIVMRKKLSRLIAKDQVISNKITINPSMNSLEDLQYAYLTE
ncbi:MAG: hypothetical protein QNJ55_04305 [Xenococcus sp. MO_188.B8]|nr:hypothetical protein [Xenococcus sp. MO_188.B8]